VAEYVGELISAETANLRAGFYNILHHVYWFDLDFGVENDRDPTMLRYVKITAFPALLIFIYGYIMGSFLARLIIRECM